MTQQNLNFDSSASQKEAILDYLRQGNRITPLLALERFKCMRLGGRIYDLKKEGFPIEKEMVQVPSGKYVACYWLAEAK